MAIFFVGETLAAGTWYWYDLTVPRFGGSAITNNQTKDYPWEASIHSHLIGGNYDLNYRLESVNNSSRSSWYKINDWHTVVFNTTAVVNDVVHGRLKTDTFDPVNIQANGHWSPDWP